MSNPPTPSKTIQKQPKSCPVDINELINFLYPNDLQHPLASARLFIFCEYGPLVDNQLRSGPARSHVLAIWELDNMCMQFEREDVIQIYLHRKRDYGLLSSAEQEAIIQQADAHLKRAKGKSMLPVLKKTDLFELIKDLKRDEIGNIDFHELQKVVQNYRNERIKEYKLVYPSIKGNTLPLNLVKVPLKKHARVSASVAPPTMFESMKGNTNSDIIDQTNKYLSKYAYKIRELDDTSGAGLTTNVRLLREIEPAIPNERKDVKRLSPWDGTSCFKGTSLGSLVKAAPSSSTWIRKTTI